MGGKREQRKRKQRKERLNKKRIEGVFETVEKSDLGLLLDEVSDERRYSGPESWLYDDRLRELVKRLEQEGLFGGISSTTTLYEINKFEEGKQPDGQLKFDGYILLNRKDMTVLMTIDSRPKGKSLNYLEKQLMGVREMYEELARDLGVKNGRAQLTLVVYNPSTGKHTKPKRTIV